MHRILSSSKYIWKLPMCLSGARLNPFLIFLLLFVFFLFYFFKYYFYRYSKRLLLTTAVDELTLARPSISLCPLNLGDVFFAVAESEWVSEWQLQRIKVEGRLCALTCYFSQWFQETADRFDKYLGIQLQCAKSSPAVMRPLTYTMLYRARYISRMGGTYGLLDKAPAGSVNNVPEYIIGAAYIICGSGFECPG